VRKVERNKQLTVFSSSHAKMAKDDDDHHEEDWEMTLNRYRALRAEPHL
jgi:hypothetical protein